MSLSLPTAAAAALQETSQMCCCGGDLPPPPFQAAWRPSAAGRMAPPSTPASLWHAACPPWRPGGRAPRITVSPSCGAYITFAKTWFKAPCSCCRKVLRNAATLQTARARFPLLCTPSRTLHQAEWPAEARDARALHPKCGPVRASNISHQKKTNLSDSAFHPRSR